MKNYWQGKRIALRGLEPSDAPFFLEWNQETLTQQNLDQIWFPSSLARVEEWAHKQALKPVDDDSYFFVITQLSGEPVGMIHTNDCDKKNGHFGYGLGVTADHRKMGYASEAIRMVLSYYFNQLRYHKAIVGVYGFNEASIHLHKKLGFQEEGRLREMVYAGNKFHDLLKFGLLKREFNQSPLV